MKHKTFTCQCAFCGAEFQGKTTAAKFCCDACRLRWFRFRQRVPDAFQRAEKAIQELIYLTGQGCTANASWDKLAELQARLNWLMQADPVGTRKLPL